MVKPVLWVPGMLPTGVREFLIAPVPFTQACFTPLNALPFLLVGSLAFWPLLNMFKAGEK